ncbi:V-type proton ATPase 116 kDa subunit a1 [Coccinella septempunctata]|uniref:V-type proton ATPase 116 kDa subunit a1 n=1 Tax=Coccinella septempunctata TaxID=41139 RepID=UPI001D07B7E7|nr:V-type proton ATPase 116 kDa subunit a1 [Coccinella septempunctata]XP_044763112.1 V-type proton ATPase 116 kDa subunit a1 [Coccinella septempunctata]
MGSMFRSEEMSLAQLFIQPEAAYFVISELGETGTVQFRDLNENVNAFQKKFVTEVRRCDEMERKLRYIEAEVNKDKVNIPDVRELPRAPNPREIIDLEAHLEKTEADIKEFSESAVSLKCNFLELTELKHVLEKTQLFFNEQDDVSGGLDNKALITEDSQTASGRGRLGFVAGVIKRERVPAFERMLWRISRGNIFLRQADVGIALEDPITGNEINKTVFVAFFQGEQLKSRIKKVCAGFHASMYPCPSTIQERDEMLNGVKLRLKDLEMVLNQTQDHRQRVLVSVAKELQNWSIMVSKMKAIYHTLNFFNVDVTKKCLIGECWVATKDIGIVQKALVDGSSVSGSSIPSFMNIIETMENPPTFNRTNKFTRGFQNLIDAYGVSSYREVNPALYTIITFPFLFAIMFGDVGHALVMFGFALYMVLAEKKLTAMKNKGEIVNIFFAGRYIILLMSIFSMYTGFIYNDIFSKSMNIFGSRWKNLYDHNSIGTAQAFDLDPAEAYMGTPYLFGVDPIWQMAKNKIIFLNSFKMKLSIIFGVLHMIFGVCMSIPNFINFKRKADIFLQFVPQIVFLCCIFLWMVVMIFIKWIKYAADPGLPTKLGTSCAPSVLIYFINMMLQKTQEAPDAGQSEKKAPEDRCDAYMFDFQHTLQVGLVVVALIMVPIMLFGKPLHFKLTHGKKSKRSSTLSRNGGVHPAQDQSLELIKITDLNKENSDTNGHGVVDKDGNQEVAFRPLPAQKKEEHGEHEEEEFSEIMIHQAIHTIEYVLSTVSHTASYLRLWALSLAHAQLSEVLWSMLFSKAFKMEGYIGVAAIYILFAAWAFFSVAILVLMEGLSAFLHTLRLHWVEFMSKFFVGEGHAFQPFSFNTFLETEGEE